MAAPAGQEAAEDFALILPPFRALRANGPAPQALLIGNFLAAGRALGEFPAGIQGEFEGVSFHFHPSGRVPAQTWAPGRKA